MTTEEKTAYLATEVMGWRWFDDEGRYAGCWHKGTTDKYGDIEIFTRDFSPATDLNHQQMVLEKLSEEELEEIGARIVRHQNDTVDLRADMWTRKKRAGLSLLLPTLTRFNLIYDAVKGVRDDQ